AGVSMMVDLKVMAYFKISLSTRNWDRAFEKGQMEMILNEMASSLDEVISAVRQQLPDTFPVQIADSILDGLSTRARRLTL
nr:hypothetical protein [Aeromonas veronii]